MGKLPLIEDSHLSSHFRLNMKTEKTILAALVCFTGSVFPLLAATLEIPKEDAAAIDRRNEFLQQNFSRFPTAQFMKDQNSEAAIHILPVKESIFEYEGWCFCGFKFSVPVWLDGDFKWMFLLAKSETNQSFVVKRITWYIIPETGRSEGFTNGWRGFVDDYPDIKALFPYTAGINVQSLPQNRLKPGSNYAIWFRFEERDMPDIAFSMTIQSERGAKEFGFLPSEKWKVEESKAAEYRKDFHGKSPEAMRHLAVHYFLQSAAKDTYEGQTIARELIQNGYGPEQITRVYSAAQSLSFINVSDIRDPNYKNRIYERRKQTAKDDLARESLNINWPMITNTNLLDKLLDLRPTVNYLGTNKPIAIAAQKPTDRVLTAQDILDYIKAHPSVPTSTSGAFAPAIMSPQEK
jgi:hypothetical protein